MSTRSIFTSTKIRLATLGMGLAAALATAPVLAQAQVVIWPMCRTIVVGYDVFGNAILRTVCGY